MRIVCMTNEGQLDMMKNMLRSAMNCGMDMSKFHCYILNDEKDAATYNTVEFKRLTIRKLEVILENMKLDKEVIWIDNDIVLFQNCINDLRSRPGKFVIQDDLWGACTGFFLVRSDWSSLKVINDCIQWLHANSDKTHLNDQHAFNYIYRRVMGATISMLPVEEYPNGYIYFDQKKQSRAKMVHCNYMLTTPEKIQRMKDHSMWDPNELAFGLVNKYYI